MAFVIENDINRRLIEPRDAIGIEALMDRWSVDVVEATVAGCGALNAAPNLLNKVRGAFGEALLAGASERVRARMPCDWRPVCAAEVFFGRKPSITLGDHASEIPKPFVLSCRRAGQDLIVRMTMFGFARDWGQAAALAFVDALRNRVRWFRLARDLSVFVPRRIEIRGLRSVTDVRAQVIEVPTALRLDFRAPVDAERGSVRDDPRTIFRRLIRRVALLARWYDAALNFSARHLDEVLSDFEIEFVDSDDYRLKTSHRRRGHHMMNAVIDVPAIRLSGDLGELWPYLLIGATAHVGRGAAVGLGQFDVTPLREQDVRLALTG